MKNINLNISNESYKIISDYKLYRNLKKLSLALDLILKEYIEIKNNGD